jgi:hypothetical protein
MTTYSMTVETLVGKGPSDPEPNDAEKALAIVTRMNQLLEADNIEIRLGRENSSIDFEHRCSIENALARAHSQFCSSSSAG